MRCGPVPGPVTPPISGNLTSGHGGGVHNNYGTLTVINSTISGNTALIRGGGADNSYYPSTLAVINSTISGNTALLGGGGTVNHSTLAVINSTISRNEAGVSKESFGGGGVLNRYPRYYPCDGQHHLGQYGSRWRRCE